MAANNENNRQRKFIKALRKWSRILHRDIGFFFVGTSIIYGLSGIALNHLKDWNPNYIVSVSNFVTERNINPQNADNQIPLLLDDLNIKETYKTHYFPDAKHLKIYLQGGSTIELNLTDGTGNFEHLRRRPLFYEANFLHYNPNRIWTFFSDFFAFSLILFALTSLFMVRGKKGPIGRGGIYILAGIVIPVVIYLFV